jgi:hypothetical protein
MHLLIHDYPATIENGVRSSVGMTIRYGLDGPEKEFRWGLVLPHPSKLALGSIQSLTEWVPFYIRGQSCWAVALTTHPSSSAEVEERVELYLYTPSLPLRPILRRLYLLFSIGICRNI